MSAILAEEFEPEDLEDGVDIDLVAWFTARTATSGERVVEIAAFWGDAILDVRTYARGRLPADGGGLPGFVGWRGTSPVLRDDADVEDRGGAVVVRDGLVAWVVHEVAASDRVRPAFAVDRGLVVSLAGTTLAFAALAQVVRTSEDPPQGTIVEIPDRFVELMLAPEAELGRKKHGNPDAGEGAKAKKQEGKVGKKDARMEHAKGDRIRMSRADVERAALRSPTNGVVDVASDPRSTFGMDVDTGSFSMARKELLAGRLPDPSTVRPEEFVNAVRYDDESAGDATFGVTVEGAPNPWVRDHTLLRVGVQARRPTARRPVHLVFLVDVSGSMAAYDKLPLVKTALHGLVRQLGPDDTVGIVTYAGAVREALAPTPATRTSDVDDAIDALSSGGGTAMASGMDLAYAMAADGVAPGAESRVVVLTDGDTNIGPLSWEEMLASIHDHARRGITMSTVGFGEASNDALLEQLADHGDGNYSYVGDEQDARTVFGRDVAGTLVTVARDAKIQVSFDPRAVYAYRLIGYEDRDIADDDFRDDHVDAGEVGSGQHVTALYDVVLKDHPTHDVATVSVRAKPGDDKDAPASEWTTRLPVSALALEWPDASRDLRVAFAAAELAEILRGSPYAQERTPADVVRLLDERPGTDDEDLRTLRSMAAAASARWP